MFVVTEAMMKVRFSLSCQDLDFARRAIMEEVLTFDPAGSIA